MRPTHLAALTVVLAVGGLTVQARAQSDIDPQYGAAAAAAAAAGEAQFKAQTASDVAAYGADVAAAHAALNNSSKNVAASQTTAQAPTYQGVGTGYFQDAAAAIDGNTTGAGYGGTQYPQDTNINAGPSNQIFISAMDYKGSDGKCYHYNREGGAITNTVIDCDTAGAKTGNPIQPLPPGVSDPSQLSATDPNFNYMFNNAECGFAQGANGPAAGPYTNANVTGRNNIEAYPTTCGGFGNVIPRYSYDIATNKWIRVDNLH